MTSSDSLDRKISDLKGMIRDIPDFPSEGIMFRDITPLLANPDGLSMAVDLMVKPYRGQEIDVVIGAESRGFIFGTAIAHALNTGFVPVRKPGKLPGETVTEEYELEYGKGALQIHTDAIQPGQRVLIVDDLIATGGTLVACRNLVKSLGAEIIGISVLIELSELDGARLLEPETLFSVLRY
ncbi:MAG: adenine phosphoribosyltransferase [Phycisphaerales bacterium]|nr:adenine phosphoribosyltransferase [Phycisphaerales bacterium]